MSLFNYFIHSSEVQYMINTDLFRWRYSGYPGRFKPTEVVKKREW